MKNLGMNLEILNKTIKKMYENEVQIIDPDDKNYRLSGVVYDPVKEKVYFSIELAEEEEEE